MFCTHIYQKTSINTIILGNAYIKKPSYLKQLTYNLYSHKLQLQTQEIINKNKGKRKTHNVSNAY